MFSPNQISPENYATPATKEVNFDEDTIREQVMALKLLEAYHMLDKRKELLGTKLQRKT